ncbi:MAG: hypothetical protein NT169_05440 [Chloroflexi bacterium]|nr:hypothetical protein [Chloroflexota bacterium]
MSVPAAPNVRAVIARGRSPEAIPSALALGGYLFLTLALTYPLVREFTAAIPGDSFDGWQNFWNLWWMRTALLEQHASPYFTHLLYAPTGVGLLFHTLNPFNGLLTLPVQIAGGLFPAYNAAILFSFALGGFGAYLLARYVLGSGSSRLAAFVAGVIFTFSPFHVAHLLGHMQVISLEWIPFFALYLLRAVDGAQNANRKSQIAKRKSQIARRKSAICNLQSAICNLKDVFLAAFFLALVALCDWYYVLYCLIFSAVVLIWAIWRGWAETFRWPRSSTYPFSSAAAPAPLPSRPFAPLPRLLAAVAAVWLLWAIAFSPLLAPMVREARQSRFMVPDPAQSRTLSADLLAFVTPQEFHPLWGKWAQERAKVFAATVSEHSVFIGYTVLALAVLGAWASSRRVGKQSAIRNLRSAIRGPWLIVLLVFIVLALGPVLHIAGRADLLPGGGEIGLPYGWLVRIVPFMDITRSVSRFDVMVMLVMAVLAGRGVEWLMRPSDLSPSPFPAREGGWGVRSRRWLAVAALALILFEFLPAPYPMSAADTPAWYRTLAADPRPGAVLNLPMNWDRPGYLLYQTEHGKPLTVAYISRDDPRTLTDRAPVLQHFRHLGPDVIAFDLARQGRQVLADLGVRWVVLDRYKMPGGRERAYTEAAAREIFGDQPVVYADERITVYEVTPPATAAPYLVLGVGWEAFDKTTRAFTGNAPIIVRSPDARTATLRVTLAPDSAALDLPGEGGIYRITLTLQPGENEVTLRARAEGGRVIVTELALEP